MTRIKSLLAMALVTFGLFASIPAEAGYGSYRSSSFGSYRSYSSPSRSYSAPSINRYTRPAPVAPRPSYTPPRPVVNKTVINKTTVVQHSAPSSSGGSGFLTGTLLGGLGGYWWGHRSATAASEQPVVQCLDTSGRVVPCPPKEVK